MFEAKHNTLDHGEEATRYLKAFLGPHYNFSNQPTFKSLWDTYNRCQFVEDEGNGFVHRTSVALMDLLTL